MLNRRGRKKRKTLQFFSVPWYMPIQSGKAALAVSVIGILKRHWCFRESHIKAATPLFRYSKYYWSKSCGFSFPLKNRGARTTNFVDGVAHERVRLTKIDVRVFLRQLVLSLGQRTHTFQDDCFMVSQQWGKVLCENGLSKTLFVYSVLIYSMFVYSGLFPIFNAWTGEVFLAFSKKLSLDI